jgi:DNA-binding response OmpR family regulator
MQTRTKSPDKRLIIVGTVDKMIEDALGKQLNNPNYEVRFVRKAVNVLLETLENVIDILILDMDLVGIDGMEILPIIKKMRPRLPVILITEDYTYRVRKAVAEHGVTYQAFKPMSPAEVGSIRLAAEKILTKKSAVEFLLNNY